MSNTKEWHYMERRTVHFCQKKIDSYLGTNPTSLNRLGKGFSVIRDSTYIYAMIREKQKKHAMICEIEVGCDS